MKKIFFVVLLIILVIFIYNILGSETDIYNEEIRGMYISYIDIESHLKNKSETDVDSEIKEMITNLKNDGFNTIILHVRPFSDAIYNSSIFPSSISVVENEGDLLELDILKLFINYSHNLGMKLFAWINPYRIRNTTDISVISNKNPAFKMIGTNSVAVIENKGIYYNPSSIIVEDLIISGVEEIINNYRIDGVLFDDYFYPSNDIDNVEYEDYLNNGGTLDIRNYRYQVISNMIKRVYTTIKKLNSSILFGISPDANINNNLDYNYLDIINILDSEGYLDFISPQIYYGFKNENKPFIKVLNEWNNYIKTNVSLIPALAFYKVGMIDNYAGLGSNEWLSNNNIIKNQVLVSRNMSKYKGFFLFRYDSFYSNNTNNIASRNSLLEAL